MPQNTNCCVIDSGGYYVEYVAMATQKDGSLAPCEYILKDGEQLINVDPPSGMMKPHWNGTAWAETGTRVITEADVEQLRTQKLSEVSNACTATIYAGIDLETSQGTEHFALTLEDQNNILNLLLQVQAGLSSVPYHADGQSCRPFTAEEITALAAAATQFKTYQLTYCNQLNTWIRRETDYNTLEGITYGAELPTDLAANMDAMMALSTANTGT